ncbi:chemotaxis protein CheA [Caproiciproducens faecalis]|uniref:Chemotaxis protein CheA n=1 Tax=Caproiciproducens faecalis TaxID=2820301 RepID=A0ABS7DQ03_9FIRM|nr:chemotaxis protein CheA [Caproiciproducens faecalis]MBW7573384.1 chemotaxis protein CheA [Caproiciproducens faecalis]
MDNNMESMLEVYLFEANDLLEHLDEILINCEKANAFDTDSINEIFRIMHTIKGSSAMMQFNSLMTISHKAEDLFYYVRENGIDEKYNAELFELMFRSSDFIKDEISKVENNEPLTTDIGTFEQEINDFLKKISSKESEQSDVPPQAQAPVQTAEQTPAAPTQPVPAEKLTKMVQSSAVSAKADPDYPYSVKVFFDEDTEMENLRAVMLVNAVRDIYQDIRYLPKDIDTNPGSAEEIIKNGFLISFKEQQGLASVLKVIENFVYTKNYTVLDQAENAAKAESAEKTSAGESPRPGQETPGANHGAVKQNLINVNLSKLDNLMDLMGEIVITESMVTTVPSAQSSAGVDSNFTKASRQLRKLTDELQEIVMSIRMVPISGVFQKMNRIVRDMSKKLDKDVQLVMVGEETEVDKTIIDNIGDPIMHLVRNAMDHGIETKEEREQTSKSPRGTITLSAQNTGGEILISVQDDGKGIDKQSVLQKAKRQGLLKKPENEYSTREIYNFLLMPGFSTNEVVTEFSGRGVGMDVVKKNVEKVGGDVSLISEVGKGTKILFKIPLTLAIVNGMKISVGETVFTIPINNIRQSFKVDQSSIHFDTDMNEIIMVRNQYYPVLRLHKIFGIETETTDISAGIVILVETHEKAYCLFADALLGEQQVVVKSLPMYLNQYNVKETGITGCAILGDGSISLILDILNLYNNN